MSSLTMLFLVALSLKVATFGELQMVNKWSFLIEVFLLC